MPARSKPTAVRGFALFSVLGPGLVLAAAGVGAGDVSMGALAGSRFGIALFWVPIVAAILKYALNEGMARWQLATGETIVEGWCDRLGRPAGYAFLVYLFLWTAPVFGSLASTSGVAADLLMPLATVALIFEGPVFVGGPDRADIVWSVILLGLCFGIVWWGRYQLFERIMSVMTIVMVVVIMSAAILLWPADLGSFRGPFFPEGSASIVFAVMGGTGSTVGVLAYGYWIRERGRDDPSWLSVTRIDLCCCYVVSGIFGVAMMLLVGGSQGEGTAKPKISEIFAGVSDRLREELGLGATLGSGAAFVFQLALVATVTSSLLGMLQSVPYFYADLFSVMRRSRDAGRPKAPLDGSRSYWVILVIVTLLPVPLILWKLPSDLLVLYAIWGSLFMPIVAGSLLVLNNRGDWMGSLRNRIPSNLALVGTLMVFGWGAAHAIVEWWTTSQTMGVG